MIDAYIRIIDDNDIKNVNFTHYIQDKQCEIPRINKKACCR